MCVYNLFESSFLLYRHAWPEKLMKRKLKHIGICYIKIFQCIPIQHKDLQALHPITTTTWTLMSKRRILKLGKITANWSTVLCCIDKKFSWKNNSVYVKVSGSIWGFRSHLWRGKGIHVYRNNIWNSLWKLF